MILAFLCFDNASLSPIAEVITRDLDETVEVYSFGIRPAHVSRAARRVLTLSLIHILTLPTICSV